MKFFGIWERPNADEKIKGDVREETGSRLALKD